MVRHRIVSRCWDVLRVGPLGAGRLGRRAMKQIRGALLLDRRGSVVTPHFYGARAVPVHLRAHLV